MATQNTAKWTIEGDYYQACSCDYGCPCQFQAPPTQGFCADVSVWTVDKGSLGDVSLDGTAFGVSAWWPEALHKGNGTAMVFIDERANEQQREAILTIVSRKAGGLPFEIIAQITPNIVGVEFVPFDIQGSGNKKSIKMGDKVAAAFDSIKNPVTGVPESASVTHGTGFFFKEGDVVAATLCRSELGGKLEFSYPDKAGYIARVNLPY